MLTLSLKKKKKKTYASKKMYTFVLSSKQYLIHIGNIVYASITSFFPIPYRDTYVPQSTGLGQVGLRFLSFLEEIGRIYRITISRIIEQLALSFFCLINFYSEIFRFPYAFQIVVRHPFLFCLNVEEKSNYLFLILTGTIRYQKVYNFIY